MGIFFWRYEFEPEFPLCVLEYETATAEDLMHSHDYLEVALCLEGSGVFKFGTRQFAIAPGDIFLIDNLEAHVAHAAPGQRVRLLLALFSPELIAPPGCRPFDSVYLTPFVESGTVSPRIDHDTALAHELAPILFELRDAAASRTVADRYLVDADLRRFLAIVIRHRGAVPSEVKLAALDSQQLGPALAYVGAHFKEPIALDQVAEIMHMSASRARHVFKQLTGVGFKEYVTRLRLTEAKRLLLKTEANVSEVAVAVGYTNIHQFYKVFYRFAAMSPADYRRHYTVPSSPRPPAARPVLAPEFALN